MDKPDVVEDLYGVYLLYSLNEKYLGRTYIGYTVNPKRRINQHNKGYFAGGARRTSKKGPWKMVLIIHGFPNNIAALRFEWAWQNPERSRRLQHVINKKRIPRKESHIQYRIRILSEMLRVGPWKRLPLTIRWLETDFQQDFTVGKLPPIHMPILYGPVLSKKISSSQQKMSQDIPNKDSDSPETKSDSYFTCHICKMKIQNNKLECINFNCDFTSHINCLAKIFLEKDEYIPIEGYCPSCNRKILWGDLIRKLKGCQIQNDAYNDFEDGDNEESSELSDSEASNDSDKSMN